MSCGKKSVENDEHTALATNMPMRHCPLHARFHFSNFHATERKSTDWSVLTLEQIFDNPVVLFQFQRFCISMCAEENIMFLIDYSRYVTHLYKSSQPERYSYQTPPPIEKLLGTTPEDEMFAHLPETVFVPGTVLVEEYLAENSSMELNVSSELRTAVLRHYRQNNKRVYPTLFHEVRLEIQRLLRQNYLKPFQNFMEAEEKKCMTPGATLSDKKQAIKICIVGGGFCGLTAARLLDKMLHKRSTSGLPVQLTLFDNKAFFEFTPIVPKRMVRGDPAIRYAVNHKDYLKSPNASFVLGHVKQVRDGYVQAEGNKMFEYDYVVIATGSAYASGIKVKEAVSLDFRAKTLAKEHANLAQIAAKKGNVLIIGGGIVGVEMAGEIMQAFPAIKVTIVASRKRLLHQMPQRAHDEVHAQLVAGGVDIVLGEAIQRYDEKLGAYISSKGTVFKPDTVFWCGGPSPLNSVLTNSFPEDVSETGEVKVNEFLQLNSRPNVFVGGDMINERQNRLAGPAVAQGKCIAENISRLVWGTPGAVLQKCPPWQRNIWISVGAGFGIRVDDVQVAVSPRWELAQRRFAQLFYRQLSDPGFKEHHWGQMLRLVSPCTYFSLCCWCPCIAPKQLKLLEKHENSDKNEKALPKKGVAPPS